MIRAVDCEGLDTSKFGRQSLNMGRENLLTDFHDFMSRLARPIVLNKKKPVMWQVLRFR